MTLATTRQRRLNDVRARVDLETERQRVIEDYAATLVEVRLRVLPGRRRRGHGERRDEAVGT